MRHAVRAGLRRHPWLGSAPLADDDVLGYQWGILPCGVGQGFGVCAGNTPALRNIRNLWHIRTHSCDVEFATPVGGVQPPARYPLYPGDTHAVVVGAGDQDDAAAVRAG